MGNYDWPPYVPTLRERWGHFLERQEDERREFLRWLFQKWGKWPRNHD